jgi:hypothetical protein
MSAADVSTTTVRPATVGQGLHKQAIITFNEAWKLVPEPATEWEASTWVLAAIGDAAFARGFWTSGFDAFHYALRGSAGATNPFVLLCLGQCQFELELLDEVADSLAKAYMLEGRKIFARENLKYFGFLQTRIEPPLSGQC